MADDRKQMTDENRAWPESLIAGRRSARWPTLLGYWSLVICRVPLSAGCLLYCSEGRKWHYLL